MIKLKKNILFLKYAIILLSLSGNIISHVSGEIINITLAPGEQVVTPIRDLKLGDHVTGTITISGGGNEIKYWVIDPDGNTVIHLGIVLQSKSFEFTANTNGLYSARLDNRESTAEKTVNIEYSVEVEEDKLDIFYWGKILGVLIAAILLAYYLRSQLQKREKLTNP